MNSARQSDMSPLEVQTSGAQGETRSHETARRESLVPHTTRYRAYRAPRTHGEAFIDPPLDQAQSLIQENRRLVGEYAFPGEAMRRSARRQLLSDAIRYTSSYRDASWAERFLESDAPAAFILAGHQPDLFHPGVWFKNFALSHLAARTDSVAINLVIDNDVGSGSSIRVPTIEASNGRATLKRIRYDEAGGGVPYEQSEIRDRELFDSFASRVASTIAPLVHDPCVDRLWQHATEAIQRCGVAGCALAQARHGLEGELGLKTLEIPLGVVCRTTAFAEFVLAILTELPRFHRCYNDSVHAYRRAHHIRSSAHPVPDLAEDDEWFEAPLWLYGNDDPQRRGVWVRLSDDTLVISDRHHREERIDVRYPKLAAEQLTGLFSPDFKLRPRALLTTMYARLVLSDLFLHGIGGGKYDQLGDQIMQSFFMVKPPRFMVLSATVQLPEVSEASDSDDRAGTIRRLKRAVRDTFYQPERFSGEVALDAELLKRKRQLLEAMPREGSKKNWHDQITAVNVALADQLAAKRERLYSELGRVEQQAGEQAMLRSREFPFCLFPAEYLQQCYGRHLV